MLALQWRPRSVVRKTRDASAPPVANHAFRPPELVRHCPLAAKFASPSRAAGMPSAGSRCQLCPPSRVVSVRNVPLTGSPTISPLRRSKKVTQL
ncbi:hypothetical protein GCM10009863_23670 [Streptomyces axinellae]|uniref:Uncharacterized protein n=1 Tax=Streptomyces axinellae TaxID=552788 RepID=A0ABP6C9W1_9ACTN